VSVNDLHKGVSSFVFRVKQITQNLLSARVCGFESHHRHQTLTARKPLIYRGLRAFLYALHSYVVSLAHQQIYHFQADFWRDIVISTQNMESY